MAIYDTDEELNSREHTAHSTGTAPSTTPGAQAEIDQLNAAFNEPARADEDRNTGKPEAGDDLYKPDNEDSPAKTKGKKKRRRRGIAALLIGGLVGVGGVNLFSSVSQPFQLIHNAELMLHANHHNEDNGDITLGKEIRYLHSGGNLGETRIGTLGSLVVNKTLNKLDGIGLQPDYGDLNTYKGFIIDTANPSSPYYKMDEAKVKAELAKQGITSGISTDGGKIKVTSDGYFSQKGSEKALVKNLGVSKLSTAVRVRFLSKYGLVTWHPFKQLDKKLNQKALDGLRAAWEKTREKFLQSGQGGTEIDATHAQTKDDKGKITDTPGADATPTEGDMSSKLKAIAGGKSFKVAGGVAAAVGLACAVRAIGEHIHVIVYAQVILPASRMAWDTVTMGQQVMFGKDVDIGEMGIAAHQFYDSVSKTSFNSGKPFNPSGNGPDMSQGTKDLLSGQLPSWLAWSQSGAMGDLCGTVGTAITTTVSVVVGVLSGGVISTAAGFVASALAGPSIIDYVAKLASGNSINVLSQGGERGVDAFYGSYLNANTVAVQNGGTVASPAVISRLNAEQEKADSAEFHSKSLAYRLFNPTDNRTLFSHIIDSSGASPSQNLAILAHGFARMGSTLLRLPATLFTGIAHADATYTMPFNSFMPPDADSTAANAVAQNPDVAAHVLDGNPDYIAKAQKCFNVNIMKDAAGKWDVVQGASGDVNALDFYDPSTYNVNDCASDADQNWSLVKAFIQATNSLEGYACVAIGDNQSCTNSGFTNTDANGNPVSMQTQANRTALAYQQMASNQVQLQPVLAAGANQTMASIGKLLGAIF